METFVNIGFAKISVSAEKIWVALNLGEEGEGGGGKGSFQLPLARTLIGAVICFFNQTHYSFS